MTKSMFAAAVASLLLSPAALASEPSAESPAPTEAGSTGDADAADTDTASSTATEAPPPAEPPAEPPAAEQAAPAPPPMLGDRDGIWGEIGLHYRARPELRYNSDFDAQQADTTLFGLQRARLSLGLHAQDWLHGFVQLQDARWAGLGNSSVAYTGNTDLHQAWVRFSLPADISLKLGRQQLVYGDQRLIGHLEWANQGRVFEAAVARWDHGLGWLDLFASVFAPRPGGNLLDATHFFGLYDQLTFLDGMIVWEQYALGLVDSGGAMAPGQLFDATLEEQPPSPQRQVATLGSRLRFKGFGVDGGLEGAYQLGYTHAGDRTSLNAFALHCDARYNIPVVTKPYVGVEANYGSGDASGSERVSERFINLFPTNHMHYGAMDLQNWANAINGALFAGLSLGKAMSLRLDYWIHARATADDGWYNAGGKLLAANDPANPSGVDDELLLGHEVNGSFKWKIAKGVVLVDGIGVFVPAGFGTSLGSDPQLWAFSMLIVTL